MKQRSLALDEYYGPLVLEGAQTDGTVLTSHVGLPGWKGGQDNSRKQDGWQQEESIQKKEAHQTLVMKVILGGWNGYVSAPTGTEEG